MDHDVMLTITTENPHVSRIWIEEANGCFCAMIAHYSHFEVSNITNEEDAEKEIVFVIDRSGSMQGVAFENAQKAITMALQLLAQKADRFVISLNFDAVAAERSFYKDVGSAAF